MLRIFWKGRKNQNTERKTESLLFSGFDNGTSHAMSENRQLKDLPQAEFGRVPEKFLLTVRTKSVNENFVYLKR